MERPLETAQISFLHVHLIKEIENEMKITERVLAAAAEGNQSYRPDEHSKTAFDLAWHIASADCWFAKSICKGSFTGSDDGKKPSEVKNIRDVLSWYRNNFTAALEELRSLSTEALAKPVAFFSVCTLPAVLYLGWLRNHSIHHRGQLSAYLRAMGSKVPQIYGGSFDQPM